MPRQTYLTKLINFHPLSFFLFRQPRINIQIQAFNFNFTANFSFEYPIPSLPPTSPFAFTFSFFAPTSLTLCLFHLSFFLSSALRLSHWMAQLRYVCEVPKTVRRVIRAFKWLNRRRCFVEPICSARNVGHAIKPARFPRKNHYHAPQISGN